MRISFYRADHTGIHRFTAVEDLAVNPFRRDAITRKCRLHIRHKDSRSTKVNVRPWRDADLFEHRSRQMTGGIEILAQLVDGGRFAVTDIASAVREGEHQAADFGGKGMVFAISSCVEP